jgi:hypothetical protein
MTSQALALARGLMLRTRDKKLAQQRKLICSGLASQHSNNGTAQHLNHGTADSQQQHETVL